MPPHTNNGFRTVQNIPYNMMRVEAGNWEAFVDGRNLFLDERKDLNFNAHERRGQIYLHSGYNYRR